MQSAVCLLAKLPNIKTRMISLQRITPAPHAVYVVRLRQKQTWSRSTGSFGCGACWKSSCLRWRRRAAAVPPAGGLCTCAPAPRCRWAAAGTGWRPPGWSRCTSVHGEEEDELRPMMTIAVDSLIPMSRRTYWTAAALQHSDAWTRKDCSWIESLKPYCAV